MVRAVAVARSQITHVSRRRLATPLSAAVALIGCAVAAYFVADLAFTTMMRSASSPEQPRTVSRTAAAKQQVKERKRKTNTTAYNATLQLGSGFPNINFDVTSEGPRWATCFVAAHDSSRDVLEEWVVRGERENVNAFREWRQHQESQAASVKCAPRSQDATYSVRCLECVSNRASPFSPLGDVAEVNSNLIMTFNLDKCTGYCKSGVVGMSA